MRRAQVCRSVVCVGGGDKGISCSFIQASSHLVIPDERFRHLLQFLSGLPLVLIALVDPLLLDSLRRIWVQ